MAGKIVGNTDVCVSTSIAGDTVMYNKKPKGFKKCARKVCRKPHPGQTGNHKRTTFDHQQYHPTTKQDNQTPSVAISISNQGHSPTKAEVKKMNQLLLDEN